MYVCLRLIYTRCDWLWWMEDRETPRMRKYGESKMTRIMMATVPHVTSGSGLRKFQADGFLLDRVYNPHSSDDWWLVTGAVYTNHPHWLVLTMLSREVSGFLWLIRNGFVDFCMTHCVCYVYCPQELSVNCDESFLMYWFCEWKHRKSNWKKKLRSRFHFGQRTCTECVLT